MKQKLTVDELKKRLAKTTATINLGSGSLLGPMTKDDNPDELEKSLFRLLKKEGNVWNQS